jgi:nicotinamidase-related amidase
MTFSNETAALIVIDMQKGMAKRNIPQAESNIGQLLDYWRERSQSIVHIRHLSRTPGSPFLASRVLSFRSERHRGRPNMWWTSTSQTRFHKRPRTLAASARHPHSGVCWRQHEYVRRSQRSQCCLPGL